MVTVFKLLPFLFQVSMLNAASVISNNIRFCFAPVMCASFEVKQLERAQPTDLVCFRSLGDIESKAETGMILYDFGKTSVLDDKYAFHGIEHTFVLTNPTSHTVTINELKPSCICIDKDYITDDQHTQTLKIDEIQGVFPDVIDLPLTVTPGGQVKVFVSIDPQSIFPGHVLQSVDVMVQGQEKPAATLQISGLLQSGVSFSQDLLDFHKVTAGKVASILVSITLDRRIHRFLPDDIILEASSNNADISVTRIVPFNKTDKKKLPHLNAIRLAAPKNILQDFASDTKLVYRIDLQPTARIGIIMGSLSLIAPKFPNLLLLVNAHIPFAGEVVGDITASPSLVVFGNVHIGTEATKTVTITTDHPNEQMHLTSSNPNILLKMIKHESSTESFQGNQVWDLEVKLSSKTHIGVVEDKVIITTSSGQHITLPVFASVSNY